MAVSVMKTLTAFLLQLMIKKWTKILGLKVLPVVRFHYK